MNDMSARLDAYSDGELAAADFARLEQWLAADARHREMLVARATETLLLQDALRDVEYEEALASLPPQRSRWRTLLGYVHNTTTLSWILSGLFVSIILLSLALWTIPQAQPGLPGTDRAQFVARVERSSDAVWSAETDVEPGNRTDLFIGQRLELRSGWAEIKFDRGARAVLTAPAVMRIRSDNSCDLLAGELTAQADAAAAFTVETVAASIIDVGTEFGVVVSGTAVDAEVFDGEIIVRRNGDGATDQRRLVAGQAVRIALGGNGAMVEAASGKLKNFAQASSAGGVQEQLEQLPVTRSLALWLSADRGVRLDASGGVLQWSDLPVGDNRTAEPAEQPLASRRPKWVADGINGKPAVRFDGKAWLQTAKLKLGDARMVFAVFRAATGHGGQIVNMQGENNLVLSLEGDSVTTRFYHRKSGQNLGVATAPLGPAKVAVACFRYDSRNNIAELALDGQVVGSATAPVDCSEETSLHLGAHPGRHSFLHGDIGEVIVFNDALLPDEQAAVTSYLMKKYEIRPNSSP